MCDNNDVLAYIFNFLSLPHIYVICSSVCKRWYTINKKLIQCKIGSNDDLRKYVISTKLIYLGLHNRENKYSPYALLYWLMPSPLFGRRLTKNFNTIRRLTHDNDHDLYTFMRHIWPFQLPEYDVKNDKNYIIIKTRRDNSIRHRALESTDSDDDDDDDINDTQIEEICRIHYLLKWIIIECLNRIPCLVNSFKVDDRSFTVADMHVFMLKMFDFIVSEGFKKITYELTFGYKAKTPIIKYYEATESAIKDSYHSKRMIQKHDYMDYDVTHYKRSKRLRDEVYQNIEILRQMKRSKGDQ